MSTIDIVLIILAMLAMVLGLSFSMIYLRRQVIHHIQTHAHPDQARLRLLWVQLWFYIICMMVFLVSEAVLFVRGEDKAPARWLFWVAIFAWGFVGTILKIRRCRKKVASHDA
jgi:drug/metabolite transporter (DMT)-like permease